MAAKTNAMRILEQKKLPYTAHPYETADGLLDGVSVAHKTGRDAATVFKTLVTKGVNGGIYVFCIPVAEELDLKAAAKAAGAKSIAMLPVADITKTTGYIKGGCSPIGMKKAYPTFLHHSAFGHKAILVSGGKIGLQIELAPKDLVTATGAHPFAAPAI